MADGDKKLNLDMFAKPMGSVETSQGTVYIYSPTIDNYKFYSDLIEESAESRTQKVLPILISMIARTSFSEKFTPAPLEIYSRLSEADLNAIVDEFHKKLAEFRVKHPEKSCEVLAQLYTVMKITNALYNNAPAPGWFLAACFQS